MTLVVFGLLGPVEAWVGGRPARLGHIRQRAVLAALLVDVNRAVPVDQLIDRVWGERTPQRVQGTLYSYLSRLRGALGGIEGVEVVRRPGGYLLETEATVDLHQFRDLVARARTVDDARAAALMREALELWRGEPCAAVDSPWFRDLRQTLEQERLSAELDANDIALRLGLHGRLLPSLAALADEHPLDERVAGQLMLALHRDGRTADALNHYHRVRALLAEELGTDAGEPLSQLYQRLLTGDPESATPPPGSRAVVARPVPRQLPAGTRWFTGREAQLAALNKALDATSEPGGTVVITAIGGTGGIGKTSLALHWAHQNTHRFPDGQLYVDLRGFDASQAPVVPVTAARGFLDALGVDPGSVPVDPQALIGLYRSLVADRRMLILLDNAADAEQAAALLPSTPTCTVLVTSRRRLTGLATAHGARLLTLDVLPDTEARDLLSRHVGEERVTAEPAAVRALLHLCAGLPLAVSVAGARAAAEPRFPLAVLTEELRNASARLDALDAGDLAANVRAAFSVSYRTLGAPAAEAFRLLGIAPGADIGLAAASSLTGWPEAVTRGVLRELVSLHLVQEPAPGRYRMHDLVRIYAAEQASADDAGASRERALRRLMDFYLHTAYTGDLVVSPFRYHLLELAPPADGVVALQLADQAAVMEWFHAEHACLIAAQRLAAERGWDVLVWQLARVLDGFLWRQGRLHDHLALWQTGLEAAERLGADSVRAWAHRRMAHAQARAGAHEEALAHAQLGLAAAKDAGDAPEEARIHDILAWMWGRRGDDRKALAHVRRTLRLHRRGDDPLAVANALNAVGWYETRLGDHEQALAHCTDALALHRRHGFREGEACTLDSLASIAHAAGRHNDALAYYWQAHALFHDLGNLYEEANTLANIGNVHRALDQHDDARDNWRRAVELYRAQHRKTDAEQVEKKLVELDTNAAGH